MEWWRIDWKAGERNARHDREVMEDASRGIICIESACMKITNKAGRNPTPDQLIANMKKSGYPTRYIKWRNKK